MPLPVANIQGCEPSSVGVKGAAPVWAASLRNLGQGLAGSSATPYSQVAASPVSSVSPPLSATTSPVSPASPEPPPHPAANHATASAAPSQARTINPAMPCIASPPSVQPFTRG
jgi:hypothetical protein